MWFCCMTNISALCTCGCAKTLTNGVLESEKPSLDSKNRPWRTPKHEKNRQDVHKTATKCTKNAQERKKCGQDRKMCQHGLNMRRFRLGFGILWPPLVRKSSMLMQAYNAVGSNTPGAASSAADFECPNSPKTHPNSPQTFPKSIQKPSKRPFGAHLGPFF